MEISKNIKSNSIALNTPRSHAVELVLLLIVAVLGYIFTIRPKQHVLADQKNQLAGLAAQQQSILADQSQLSGLIKTMQNNSSTVGLLDQALPLSSKSYYLNLILERFMSEAGINPSGISVTPVEGTIIAGNTNLIKDPFGGSRSLKTISATIGGHATLAQVEALLRKIESSGRIMDVTSVSIGNGQNGEVTFNFVLQAYAYE